VKKADQINPENRYELPLVHSSRANRVKAKETTQFGTMRVLKAASTRFDIQEPFESLGDL
jgi:hypothetical protein